jgi:2-hydroxy-3-oxopropionate reductase
MAANLVKAGFDVTGYNRSPARVEQLVVAGGPGRRRGGHYGARLPDVRAILVGGEADLPNNDEG